MGLQNTIQSTNLQNKIVASVENTANEANAEKEAKRFAYEQAMQQLSVMEQTKYTAYKNFKMAQAECNNNKNDSKYKVAQSKYASVCCNYSDANINADILRSSYQDSIFYSGRMNTCAILANSTLA